MSDTKFQLGHIVWTDLAVENAEQVRDFYAAVVGWESQNHDMGEYCDFEIKARSSGENVAGICHARGANKDLPPHWLIYILVENLDQSIDRCTKHGGALIVGPKECGSNRYCVIKDPAGAVAGLFQMVTSGVSP